MSGLTQIPAWRELLKHRAELQSASLKELILAEPRRLESFQIACESLRLNLALNFITPKTIELLAKLAHQQKLEDWRTKLFAGEKVNTAENRAALHVALRQTGHMAIPEVRALHERMARFVSDIHKGKLRGASGRPIRHVVNIGIGGSDLGPRLAVGALTPFASGVQVHFVANADAYEFLQAVKNLNPAETLFLIVSKTFTTKETLLNAQLARQWITDKLGAQAAAQHFIGISANQKEAKNFGLAEDHIFPMWDWVGGRYSLWSAAGLSIALAAGMDNFEQMLAGAAAMDEHFKSTPLMQNMPVLLGLLGIWYRDFFNMKAQAILPYSERLRDLPRYLQQLEMESNGKSVTRDGASADYATAPIIFGECGTVGQHSFHQWLHQGSDIVPVDFVGVAEDDLGQPAHHRVLLTNMVAQAGALAFGQTEAKEPQEFYAGGRPSNLILLDRLDPRSLGLLLALYEHKTFVQGVIWQLNSFDQPGVELGKRLARELETGAKTRDKTGAFLAGLLKNVGRAKNYH